MPSERSLNDTAVRSVQNVSYCSAKARPWVLAATILGSSMAFIDGTVVNVALPALQSSLNATVVDVQWVIESYGLLLSALILTGGALGDTLGRRKVFLAGSTLFAIASIGCGLSQSIGVLLIARSVQGIGAALLAPGSLALISACFDESTRGHAIGTWSGATAITTALGPVIGGWLIQHVSWHWAFLINAPLAVAVIVISVLYVPESRDPAARHIDWIGSLLATSGLGGVVFAFLESSNRGWKAPIVLGCHGFGVIALVAFVIFERDARDPMMPLAVFRSRNFSGANLLTMLLYAAIGIFFFVFPLNLIQVQHYSTTATGAASLPMIVFMFLLSSWAGGLVAKVGPRIPLVVGPSIVAVGFLLFIIPSEHARYFTSLFPAFLVLGFGMSISVAPLTTVVMNSVDEHRAGTASGINNAVSRAAGVLAIAVLSPILVHTFGHTLERSLDAKHLPSTVVADLRAHVVDLGALQPPPGLPDQTKDAVSHAVEHAFVYAFRWTMLICACLAFASAGIAGRMISPAQRE
ncbi:MAG TPA: MFS transporter [Candidatus Koribacter sp.]|jgi:EmrB/QacA subfamily drug resistance transporter